MKSKKVLLAGLFVAGLIASAIAFNGQSEKSACCETQTECCDKPCAPLCCPGN